MNILAYLKRPHPQSENRWLIVIPVSIFIGLFMLIFQPFGLTYFHHPYKWLILLGYGGITFIILLFNLFLIPHLLKQIFKDENWTVFKHIFWLLWIIFTIGIGNYVYSNLIFSFNWSGWFTFLIFQFFTLVIGLIPIVVITISAQNRLLMRHLKSANEVNEKLKSLPETKNLNADEIITLIAENEKDKLTFKLSDLLFIESTGNYIEVNHLVDGKVKKTILRSSLRRLEDALKSYVELFRCHRAYFINVNKILHARGNSQGYRLKIENSEFEIPVSRSYTKKLKEILK